MADVKWWNPGWVASARKRPPRPTRSDILTGIVVLSTLLIAGRDTPRKSTADTDFPFPVAMRVTDSTTVEVAIPGVGIEQVRMIGIDPVKPVSPGQDTGCLVDDAVPDPMVRAPMSLAYLLVSGGYARVRALPNPSIYTPQLRVAEDNARAEGAGVWSPGGCGSSLTADGITAHPDGQAAIDPQVLLPITVPDLELPPAVRAILGDSPAIGSAL
ncbi:MAG: hypothetical protein EBT22_12220, partial [Chloroflexi bacterium]|nr:hypothetical protein [Chloroflexota bacterium]